MTQDEIIKLANNASKEWIKEFPSPEECANPVPKRYLEIFAKLVAAKECEKLLLLSTKAHNVDGNCNIVLVADIRARGQQ